MASKHDKKGRSKRTLSDFVALERYLLRSDAWRSLDPVAIAAYVQFGYRYDGSNNGRIVLGARSLADSLGVSKDTASRAIRDLIERGLVELVNQGAFNIKACHSSEYRMTAFRCDVTGALPSKTFMSWQSEIQNTVRPQGQHGPPTGTDGQRTT